MALTISNPTFNAGLTSDMFMCKAVNDGTGAAAAVYIGWQPRYIKAVNLTDGIVNEYFPDNTADKTFNTNAVGTVTVALAAGFNLIPAGTVTTTVTATGSPLSAGAGGFMMGTGILIASKTYQIMCFR